MNGKVVYSCPFVPAEWITAHDIEPLRLIPSSVNASAYGVCPYAAAFTAEASQNNDAEGIIVTTTCDQMRRAADVIRTYCSKPVFLLNVPHTWQSTTAYKIYASEIERLGKFLVGLGGKASTIDKLAEVMLEYDSNRQFSIYEVNNASLPNSNFPLALVGGPVMRNHTNIYSIIEQAGGQVVLDATETGERTLPAPFDRRLVKDDPFTALVDSYFNGIQDPFRRPNSGFYNWLKREIQARDVRGIILRRYVWCDVWHAEAHRLKEWSGLPFLHLDVGDDGCDNARILTRLTAFMESL